MLSGGVLTFGEFFLRMNYEDAADLREYIARRSPADYGLLRFMGMEIEASLNVQKGTVEVCARLEKFEEIPSDG